jgi:hypothetical protein
VSLKPRASVVGLPHLQSYLTRFASIIVSSYAAGQQALGDSDYEQRKTELLEKVQRSDRAMSLCLARALLGFALTCRGRLPLRRHERSCSCSLFTTFVS